MTKIEDMTFGTGFYDLRTFFESSLQVLGEPVGLISLQRMSPRT